MRADEARESEKAARKFFAERSKGEPIRVACFMLPALDAPTRVRRDRPSLSASPEGSNAMNAQTPIEHLIPFALLEQIEALAAAERRPASDMLREAVEGYLQERRAKIDSSVAEPIAPRRDLQQVVERILELRKGHVLPEGVTIRDLMTYGRA